MAKIEVKCPKCCKTEVIKYGKSPEGKQRYKCKNKKCKCTTFLLDYSYNGAQPNIESAIANTEAGARLWLWSIKDFLILCVLLIISVVIMTQLWTFLPFAVTAMFAFLSIRFEETTVMDYIVCAFRYFVSVQQIFIWR